MHCGRQLTPKQNAGRMTCGAMLILVPSVMMLIGVSEQYGWDTGNVLLLAMLCYVVIFSILLFFFPSMYYQSKPLPPRAHAKEIARRAEALEPSEAQLLGRRILLLSGLVFFTVLTGLSLKRGDSLASLVEGWGFLFLIFAFYALTSLSRSSASEGVRSLAYEICIQAVLLTIVIAYGDRVTWGIWVCGTIIWVWIRVSKRTHRET